MAAEQLHREERFLDSLDALVWSVPSSPWLRLFRHAGVESGDVSAMVRASGLEDALSKLRDLGVYLTTEETEGSSEVHRGSLTFALESRDLFNPTLDADFIAGTSGTRSSGTVVSASFASLLRMARNLHLTAELWDVVDRPGALWRPALPGSGGLIALLSSSVAGRVPERWFSQLDPSDSALPLAKRVANASIPWMAWPSHLPRPLHTPNENPDPVLEWCQDALAREGRATLNVYPSSASRLAQAAIDRGSRLDGLVLRLVGEPVTAAKAASIRATGAEPVNAYAFTQQGAVATACPHSVDESVHVFDHEAAVITRRRSRADGVEVDALLWTSISRSCRSVWINVENDDYGLVTRSEEACGCLLGEIGMRTRLSNIRGMSKSVTGGITLPSSVVGELVEATLPAGFGGGPGDWQLAEGDDEGRSYLEVRADPRLGPLDEQTVADAILAALLPTEAGTLAGSVWSEPGFIRLSRSAPIPAPSGKTLVFETLPPAGGAWST